MQEDPKKDSLFRALGKSVKGKFVRLEKDGWEEALALYNAQAADLHAGREPEKETLTPSVRDLGNQFLNAKNRQREQGLLTLCTFEEYRDTCQRLISQFGRQRLLAEISQKDFSELRASLPKTWGVYRIGNEIQRVRTIFNFAFESGMVSVPQRFGPEFNKPSATAIRKHKAQKPKRLYAREEVGELISLSKVHMSAMILLGVNCGFGNTDCATLPIDAVDLDVAMIEFPRPKTGIQRRCPLWPETVEALKASLKKRPKPKNSENANLFFITKYGLSWQKRGKDAVYLEFNKTLKTAGIFRDGVGFYGLRHTFRTVADGCKDIPAIRAIMGHADDSIDATYRETIDDDRLVAVSNHVRAWQFNGTLIKNGGR